MGNESDQGKQNIQAVVLNSGIANACTGQEGKDNNQAMAEMTANALEILPSEVYTASTGVIGPQLPMEKIKKGIEALKENLSAEKNPV